MTAGDSSGRRDGHQRQRLLADARDRFLTSAEVDGSVVRDGILASWRRSQRLEVVADHLPAQRLRGWDEGSPLLVAAAPVLRQLGDQLAGEPVSVLLTDAAGTVLQRSDADAAVGRYLDRVALAPGFSYAESSVGTNGIGTALAERRPTWVNGFEHYADRLERLSCAGAPIRHPVTGALVGAVDLTSWSNTQSALMLALTSVTAERIEKALMGLVGRADVTLFRAFQHACRHHPGIVLAVDRSVVMMNETARRTLSADDQSALLERAVDALDTGEAGTVVTGLPSGASARMVRQPVVGPPARDAGTFVVSITAPPSPAARSGDGASGGYTVARVRPTPDLRLPGMVGSSPAWQRAVRSVLECRRAGEWLVLRGEPGTGKRSLLAAVQEHTEPAGHFRAFDAREIGTAPADVDTWLDLIADELDQGSGTLAVTHADQLPPAAVTGLSDLLQVHTAGPASCWVALTMNTAEPSTQVVTCLLPHFAHTLEVPSLRHRSEDVPQLVHALLDQLSRGHRLTFEFAAMQQLSRATWPGNVTQLQRVLTEVVARRRMGVVTAADLPPEGRSAARRRLTTLEALERDAIVQSLTAHGGKKSPASAELGMSRATIYRKIRDYGITDV
jgi:transcriptional regulator of acetoin/glycerol metabolism